MVSPSEVVIRISTKNNGGICVELGNDKDDSLKIG